MGTLLDTERQRRAVRRHERTRRAASLGMWVVAIASLASALSAPLRGRLHVLVEAVPFAVLHVAAASSVFVAVALAMTARGLRVGHRMAWGAALLMLVVAAGLHVLKGLDVEEAALSLALAVALVIARGSFTIRPSAAQVRRATTIAAVGTGAAVIVSTALVMLLGRSSHPGLGESARAVARRLGGAGPADLVGLGPHGAPILSAVGVALLAAVLWVLMSPRLEGTPTPAQHRTDRERARRIVREHGGGTLDYFALRDDKSWLFAGDSVVAYAVRHDVCLVSPDPIGPPHEREQVWADLMTYASGRGWSVVVIGAAESWLPVYRAAGLHPTYLGDEAIVDCAAFSTAGKDMKGLRQAVNRVDRAGVRVTFHDPASITPELRDGVERIEAASRRGDAERGFSMTLSRLFDPSDTGLMLAVATTSDDRVVGFVQWVPATDLPGWSLDVMRRDTADGVPNGVIDTLIVRTVERIAAEGGRGLGLNFAVLRTRFVETPEDVWGRAVRALLDVVAEHSQIESLAQFNDKYRPAWVPRYVVRGSAGQLPAQALAVAEAEGLVRAVPGDR